MTSTSFDDLDAHEKLCVCGDMVVRFKPDCVRLRCKCMIHTACLAIYIKSQLEDSSKVSADGIRCCYWHQCHSYIILDDVDKFSAFIGRNEIRNMKNNSTSPDSKSGPRSQSSEGITDIAVNEENNSTNFGTNEVDRFTRFAVAASFEEKGKLEFINYFQFDFFYTIILIMIIMIIIVIIMITIIII